MTSPPRSQDIGNVLQRALALHQSGQLAQAELLYREALGQAPDHFDALHLLGVLELQRRNFEAAVSLIARSVRQRDHAPAYSNLGTALLELKRHHEALANYDHALAVEPNYAEALNNRGTALRALGRIEEALVSYDRALAVQTGYVAAWTNRGNVLRALGRSEEALASYDRALALEPDNAAVLYERGTILLRLGRHDAALASCDQALAIRPDFAEALNSRGAALFGLRRHEEALAAYDQALAIKPDYVDALSNRGTALLLLGRSEAAFESYSDALAVNPKFADAWKNRGSTLLVLKRFDEAAKDFAAHLALVPEAKYTKGELLYAKLCCCDWEGHGDAVTAVVDEVLAGRPAVAPFAFLSISDSPVAQQKCAATYGADKFAPAAPALRHEARQGHDKIRIAYLSADFRDHPVANSIVELFERHDRSRFETTAISFGSESRSAIRARLDGALDRFIDVRAERDHEVARLLRHLQIDIAVDLTGYTTDCRPGILASRPAPVQASYFGFSGTMGVDYIDYILADRIVIPAAAESNYTEKIAYLPDSYLPSDAKRRIAGHTPSRQEAGLPETGFVFCSFNNSYKVTPPVFDIWMRLLRQVEASVLWLLGGTPAAMRNLRQHAAERGVAPERLIFAPAVPREDHLARHRLADLFLDTLPYNAHTTASDALWLGLPVVTCPGAAFAARVAASALNAAGLPELIARNLEDYETIALGLARIPGRLASTKAKLARNRETCRLFDTDRLRRHIESAYEVMWERWLRGEPPASFSVVPWRGKN